MMNKRPLQLAWIAMMALVVMVLVQTSCVGRAKTNRIFTPGGIKFQKAPL
jgi:hypothetical protein